MSAVPGALPHTAPWNHSPRVPPPSPVSACSGDPREIFNSKFPKLKNARLQDLSNNGRQRGTEQKSRSTTGACVLPVDLFLYNSYTGCYLVFTFSYGAVTSACVLTCANSWLHNCVPLCTCTTQAGPCAQVSLDAPGLWSSLRAPHNGYRVAPN